MRDFPIWQRIEGALVLAASLRIYSAVGGRPWIRAAVLLFMALDSSRPRLPMRKGRPGVPKRPSSRSIPTVRGQS